VSERRDDPLDPRAWLLWGAAATLPPLVGRNPFVLAATLLAVVGVRAAWGASGVVGWGGIVRLAALFAAVGVLFNLLTVHVGERVLVRLPEALPVAGGPLTLNALVYGLLSGAAVLTLVLVGTTLGAVLDGPALLRLLPSRLTAVAVAGSVAWAFVPQTAVAFRQIREAQAARGHRLRGARDLVPLLVPLLGGGLERALTLAEALESRAFGAPLGATAAPSPLRSVLAALALAGGAVGAYLLAAGWPLPALATLAAAALALAAAVRDPDRGALRRTRYRPPRWDRSARALAATAALALAAEVAVLALDPAAFAYEPYPRLVAPRVDLPLLAALGLLLAPAFVRSSPERHSYPSAVAGHEGGCHPPLPTSVATSAPPSPKRWVRGVGG
jgi:energy-coupling factor transport system permease protein